MNPWFKSNKTCLKGWEHVGGNPAKRLTPGRLQEWTLHSDTWLTETNVERTIQALHYHLLGVAVSLLQEAKFVPNISQSLSVRYFCSNQEFRCNDWWGSFERALFAVCLTIGSGNMIDLFMFWLWLPFLQVSCTKSHMVSGSLRALWHYYSCCHTDFREKAETPGKRHWCGEHGLNS